VPADIHGILLLDKPLGLSSAGAVARVKRLFNARKAGHTGSLDPLASGLLPICFGEATKFGTQLLEADKTYRVTVRLGERTPSADRESEVIETRVLPAFSLDDLQRALALFPRDYQQIPPMHSALKQDGKPLYEYAPDLSFDVRCTKGAYIRVLAEDLATQLGTIGHLAALRRLAVAPFVAEPQWPFEALEAMTLDARHEVLLPVDAALSAWRRFDLPAGGVSALRQGQSLNVAVELPGMVRIYAADIGFLGLGEIEAAGHLRPLRLISAATNRA
jgi:tRNA pseudouridine55 synthase